MMIRKGNIFIVLMRHGDCEINGIYASIHIISSMAGYFIILANLEYLFVPIVCKKI
jgi:hypothetical protein